LTKSIEQLAQFCRLIRARTEENRAAVNVLLQARLYSVAFGVLRQEIDSLIRIAYLDNIRHNYSPGRARLLIRELVEGDRWTRTTKKGKQANVTDREMLDAYQAAIGWEKIVYDFGCELIHLSKFHDYQNSDPILNLSEDSKIQIRNYLKQYHGFDRNHLTFETLVQYLPNVIDKICDNTLGITSSFEDNLRYKVE